MPRRPSAHVDSAAAVGERLRTERERAGLTQRQLAFEGCTPAYISRVETGQRIPSLQILRELSRRLGVSLDYLATGGETEPVAEPLSDADLAARLGDRTRARAIYEEFRAAAQTSGLVAQADAGLGRISFDEGDYERAIQLLEGTVELLPESQAVEAADRLGRSYALTGRLDEALALLTRCLEQARQRDDPLQTVRFSVLLANTEIDRGDPAAAERVLRRVLDTARAAVDPIARAGIYWSRSRLHASRGEPAPAARYARLALGVLETTEHTTHVAHALLLLASLENDGGRGDEALALLDDAGPVVQATGNRGDEGRLQLERARVELNRGNAHEAAGLALGALPMLATETPANAARSYALAASILRQAGQTARALELYELAAAGFPGDDRHAAEVYTALAEIAEESGRTDEALDYLKRALQARQRQPARLHH